MLLALCPKISKDTSSDKVFCKAFMDKALKKMKHFNVKNSQAAIGTPAVSYQGTMGHRQIRRQALRQYTPHFAPQKLPYE
jgi:hypothetical protein